MNVLIFFFQDHLMNANKNVNAFECNFNLLPISLSDASESSSDELNVSARAFFSVDAI
mgnify:CR=1 FL=1